MDYIGEYNIQILQFGTFLFGLNATFIDNHIQINVACDDLKQDGTMTGWNGWFLELDEADGKIDCLDSIVICFGIETNNMHKTI